MVHARGIADLAQQLDPPPVAFHFDRGGSRPQARLAGCEIRPGVSVLDPAVQHENQPGVGRQVRQSVTEIHFDAMLFRQTEKS